MIPPCTVPSGLACCGPASSSKTTRPPRRRHAEADELRRPAAARLAPATISRKRRAQRHGVSTVRITSPSCIASSASSSSSSGAGARDHPGEIERAVERPGREAREVLAGQVVAAVRDEDPRALREQPRQVERRRLPGRREPDQRRTSRPRRAARAPARTWTRRPTTSKTKSTGPWLGVRRAELRSACSSLRSSRSIARISDAPAIRAPWIAERPTAPQPITATRAPSQTLARSRARDITPVATAQPIRHACSTGSSRGILHRRDRGHDRARRERAGAQHGRQLRAVARDAAGPAPPAAACTDAARRAGTCAHDAARGLPAEHDAVAGREAGRRRRRPPRSCRRPRGRAAPGSGWPQPSSSITCRSLWQTPVASIRTSTSPGPGCVDARSPRARPTPGDAEDYTLVSHERSRSRIEWRAGEREGQVDLGHQVLDQLLDAALPAHRERVGVRAAEQHRVGAERHRLQHVGGAADAAVHQHDRVGQRVAHLDERVERGDRPVDLPAAVVRDDHPVDSVLAAPRVASSAVRTPLTRIGSDVCPRSQSRSSHVRPRFGNVASIVAAAVSRSSSGVLSSRDEEDRVAEELAAAFALDERQVGVPQVARAPAERQRVERDDDRAVPGRLGALDEARADLAVVDPVELEPARRAGLGDLLDRVRRRAREQQRDAGGRRRPCATPTSASCVRDREHADRREQERRRRAAVPSTSTEMSRAALPVSIRGRIRQPLERVEVRAHRRLGPGAARDVAEGAGVELLLGGALPVVRGDRPLGRLLRDVDRVLDQRAREAHRAILRAVSASRQAASR